MCDELPRQDSNLDKEDQNLSCYLVTLRGKGCGAQSKRLYTPFFTSTFERSPRIPPAVSPPRTGRSGSGSRTRAVVRRFLCRNALWTRTPLAGIEACDRDGARTRDLPLDRRTL